MQGEKNRIAPSVMVRDLRDAERRTTADSDVGILLRRLPNMDGEYVAVPAGVRLPLEAEYLARASTRRRAALLRARMLGRHTTAEWKALVDEFDGCCAACGESLPLEKDHVLPISMGGCDCVQNLQPLCVRCHDEKADDVIDYVKLRRAERLLEPRT